MLHGFCVWLPKIYCTAQMERSLNPRDHIEFDLWGYLTLLYQILLRFFEKNILKFLKIKFKIILKAENFNKFITKWWHHLQKVPISLWELHQANKAAGVNLWKIYEIHRAGVVRACWKYFIFTVQESRYTAVNGLSDEQATKGFRQRFSSSYWN